MDKPNEQDATAFALPGCGVLALEGPDALAFAQGQFMSDVAMLADGAWHWSGWLTPKGRLVALFMLLRRDESTFWLVLPDAGPTALAGQLARFVFRSKVALHVRDDLVPTGLHAAPAEARLGQAGTTRDWTELDMGSPHATRTLRIGPAAAPAHASADNVARWRAADLAHGLPRLDASQSERWTPQQLSLDRLQAYSVRKGCYPGQEIVARTHFLGQAKRGLVRLRGSGLAVDGECRDGDGAAVGVVVSTAGDEGLAVVAAAAMDRPLECGGASCDVLPLLDGLAR